MDSWLFEGKFKHNVSPLGIEAIKIISRFHKSSKAQEGKTINYKCFPKPGFRDTLYNICK